MHTKENDVFFLNALKVSLAPTTPQEGPFHVMFVRNQHTQEPKEPNDYDWNHLSLTVAVAAEPTLEQGHNLESQKNTFENDDQNATMRRTHVSSHQVSELDTNVRHVRIALC